MHNVMLSGDTVLHPKQDFVATWIFVILSTMLFSFKFILIQTFFSIVLKQI